MEETKMIKGNINKNEQNENKGIEIFPLYNQLIE